MFIVGLPSSEMGKVYELARPSLFATLMVDQKRANQGADRGSLFGVMLLRSEPCRRAAAVPPP